MHLYVFSFLKSLGVWRVNTVSLMAAYFLCLFANSARRTCVVRWLDGGDDKNFNKKKVQIERLWEKQACCSPWLRVSVRHSEQMLLVQIIPDFKGGPEGAQSPSYESLLFRFCLQKDKHLLVFLSPFLMLTWGRSCYLCNFGGFCKA